MKRSVKRLCCAMLAAWLVALTPLAVSAETVEEIQAQQQQLEEENQELNAKLESLREDEAQKQAYRETLQEQIDLVQQQILTTRDVYKRQRQCFRPDCFRCGWRHCAWVLYVRGSVSADHRESPSGMKCPSFPKRENTGSVFFIWKTTLLV